MARPAYSKRFIGVTVSTSAEEVGPVPVGKIWLINCVTYVLVDGSSGFVFAMVVPGPLYIFDVNVSTDPIKGNFFTHQVMNVGETLQVHSTGGDAVMSVMISGYELNV